jgi:phage FluMu protein Com
MFGPKTRKCAAAAERPFAMSDDRRAASPWWCASGQCDQRPLCMKCALRLRLLYVDKRCPVCNDVGENKNAQPAPTQPRA